MAKYSIHYAGLLLLFAATPALAEIEFRLEEPLAHQTYSGVGLIRGWALACDQPIESVSMRLDSGKVLPVPYGAPRGDVLKRYPNWPNAGYSGFAVALNYNHYEAGSHHIWLQVCTAEECAVVARDFWVVNFGSPYVSQPQIAEVATDGSGILMSGVQVAGLSYNVRLSWRPEAQQWVITTLEEGLPRLPMQTDFLPLINGLRESSGLLPVVWDDALAIAARKHSQDMADHNFVGHSGSNGSSFVERAYGAGYIGRPLAENLAAGVPGVIGVFEHWLADTQDLANMLNPQATRIGYGSGYNATATWKSYHTLMLGR